MSGAAASAVHWGVALPEGWSIGRIKNAASVTLGKMLQPADSGSDVEACYLRAANVQPDGVLRLSDAKKMWFGESQIRTLDLREGDVVVVEGGVGGYGRAAFVDSDLPGWGFQNSINRLRPQDADGRFLTYYLIAARQRGYIQAICNVVAMPHFTAEKLAVMQLPIPPWSEQHAIASYLDRETSQIDALIGKQEQLIEKLRERREAVVGYVLDAYPDKQRLKQFARVTLGKMLDAGKEPPPEAEMTRYLRAANIKKSGTVELSNLNLMPFTPAECERLNLLADDLLVVEGGAMGRPAYLVDDLPGMSFQKTVNRVRPIAGKSFGRFLYYVLLQLDRAGYHRAHIDAVSMPHLTAEKLAEVGIPRTPLEEQRRIAKYLDEQTAKIDALISKAGHFIELAKERRAALITAAVTGQIDVRTTNTSSFGEVV